MSFFEKVKSYRKVVVNNTKDLVDKAKDTVDEASSFVKELHTNIHLFGEDKQFISSSMAVAAYVAFSDQALDDEELKFVRNHIRTTNYGKATDEEVLNIFEGFRKSYDEDYAEADKQCLMEIEKAKGRPYAHTIVWLGALVGLCEGEIGDDEEDAISTIIETLELDQKDFEFTEV